MNAYQWTVLLAAWLGWGFDIFDSLLMNYVAPNAVPTLLGIPLGTPAAQSATLQWTGILTSLLLVGWCAGGIIFGKVADRIGRTKTLLLTMIMYSIGTAACAFAPNIWVLRRVSDRFQLGIGGEWAAVPRWSRRSCRKSAASRPERCYTRHRRSDFFGDICHVSDHGSLLCRSGGVVAVCVFVRLVPAAVAFVVRLFIKEPERWQKLGEASGRTPKISELFTPKYRALTISGLCMAMTALITWWSCNAFIAVVAKGLAAREAATLGLDRAAVRGDGPAVGQECDEHLQSRRPDRNASDDPGRKAARPEERCSLSTSSDRPLSLMAAFGLGPRIRIRGCICTSRSA